jgi:hypothetical protein
VVEEGRVSTFYELGTKLNALEQTDRFRSGDLAVIPFGYVPIELEFKHSLRSDKRDRLVCVLAHKLIDHGVEKSYFKAYTLVLVAGAGAVQWIRTKYLKEVDAR